MTLAPTEHIESDGVHLGINISNNVGFAQILPVSLKFPNSGFYRYQVFDTNNNLVWDSLAGKRLLSSIYWVTWGGNETKHWENVWSGYQPGQHYTFTVTVNSNYPFMGATTPAIPFQT
jgi:hypothetical protein